MLKQKTKTGPTKKDVREYYNMMIPCLNCEQLFNFQDVDNHSKQCTNVTNKVRQMGESQQTCEDVNFRIQRLRDSLLQLIGQNRINNQINSQNNIKCFRRIIDIAETLISINKIGNQEELIQIKDLEAELKILNQRNQSQIGIILHIDRLLQLLVQKLNFLKNKQEKFEQKQQKTRMASLDGSHIINEKFQVQITQSKSQQQRPTPLIQQNSELSKQLMQRLIQQKKNEFQIFHDNHLGKIIKENQKLQNSTELYHQYNQNFIIQPDTDHQKKEIDLILTSKCVQQGITPPQTFQNQNDQNFQTIRSRTQNSLANSQKDSEIRYQVESFFSNDPIFQNSNLLQVNKKNFQSKPLVKSDMDQIQEFQNNQQRQQQHINTNQLKYFSNYRIDSRLNVQNKTRNF